jgi:transposase
VLIIERWLLGRLRNRRFYGLAELNQAIQALLVDLNPSTALLCELILEHRPHPEQGFRACLGIVRLVKPFGAARVEAAAARALDIGARSYGSLKSILDHNLDRHAAPKRAGDGATVRHPNIRGSRYYH